MTAAVFDAAAIAARRLELFGLPPAPTSPPTHDRERYGTANDHCGICPKDPSENCTLSCAKARQDLNDGVTVT